LGWESVLELDRMACHGLIPDLTICIDIDTETGLARALARGGLETRLEEQAIEFHHKVREAYHELARSEPQRFRLIDGRGTPQAIAAKVWEQVAPLLLT
jgi:dTMP kinase